MAQQPPQDILRTVATIDISAFTAGPEQSVSDGDRTKAAQLLVEALHGFGFAKITGHGVSKHELDEAFTWVKRLFDLPYDDKMKAPHPAGPMPHRGYSGIGQEKVYSTADAKGHQGSDDVGKALRKISDFKESYEIGSEQDPVQQNIWLPDTVLPGYRRYMTALYDKLAGVSRTILETIAVGLSLESGEHTECMRLISDRSCQLRLLHYPAIKKDKLENELLARLPEHVDWGTITLLFQDDHGGLELKDAQSQQFLLAEPEEGSLVLNVGDMLQRFTNGYFVSALHRVSVPDPRSVSHAGIPARYSIPFFVCPEFSHTVSTLERFITPENPAKYEPVRFDEYGSEISKYQYQG
ncbi:Clavaminate synthase-like protein [Xylariomycetidae sp. FL2044]|nr:Clavaminate synthase-like protein [Xylariomycetidae sp. FL2044]